MLLCRRTAAAVTFLVLLASTVAGQEPVTRDAKLLDGPKDPASEVAYPKKWALIIGIDYRREDRDATLGDVAELKHAQSDAKAVRELLRKFGYQDKEVVSLCGTTATADKINEQIGAWCDSTKVGKGDSVLFYFSGHGHLRRSPDGTRHRGYLLPIDVKWESDGQPNIGKAIDMSGLVDRIKNDCQAHHKLLVLDCCHSGAVFKMEGFVGNHGPYDHEQRGEAVFRARAIQAITASRDNQKASDGRFGHSPFTYALLQSMESLPLWNANRFGNPAFTANDLFVAMRPYLNGESYQSPQYGYLDAEQGDFHFFPAADATFGEDRLSEEQRRQFIALAPSTFGNWWAYEVPWFMPGLRAAILEQKPQARSSVEDINRDNLLAAARSAQHLASKAKAEGKLAELFTKRYEHLDKLLNAKGKEAQKEAFEEIRADLEKLRKDHKAQEEDIHYLAVVRHLQGDFKAAKECYEEAIELYQKDTAKKAALKALCLLDLGFLELQNMDLFDEAVNHFQEARNVFERSINADQAPKPFLIFTMCREAEALRRQGKFNISEAKMQQALNLLRQWDREEATLFSSGIWKQHAWAYMEGWDFKSAAGAFGMAKAILEKELNQGRYEGKIDQFHVGHGLAMVERFQGDSAAALARYRELTPEIARTIQELENRREERPNAEEIGLLLYERLVNSLERQADCSLFGEKPDYAEAADDYRRAIGECGHLAVDNRDKTKIDILYRRSAALCLTVLARTHPGEPVPHDAPEVDLARQLYAEAAQLGATLRDVKGMTSLPLRTSLARCIALACLQVFPPSADQDRKLAAEDKPVDALQKSLADVRRAYDRDELERLMCFYKVLIDQRERLGYTRYQSMQHVSELLKLCRSACRLETPDPDLLGYLRPYYDCAFLAKKDLLPDQAKELVEIAWEATRGTSYMKPTSIQPLLVVHCVQARCYLLLDAPAGLSKCFVVDDVESRQDLIDASQSKALIAMPDEVRRALRTIQQKDPQTRIVLRWRDPVLKIGYKADAVVSGSGLNGGDGSQGGSGLLTVTTFKPKQKLDLEPDRNLTYPFSFNGLLRQGQYHEDEKENRSLEFKRPYSIQSLAAGPVTKGPVKVARP